MRRVGIYLWLFSWVFSSCGTSWAQPPPPREIAGYRLGTHIQEYGNRIAANRDYVVRLRPYLREAAVSVPEGFQSGYVIYGTCDAPGTIVRIKVKYEEDSRDFFDKLLEAVKSRYGAPTQYVGDPFQAYVAWRWNFDISNDEEITMILSHYDGDDEEHTQGNAIKLTLKSRMMREAQCYRAQQEKERRRGRLPFRTRRPLRFPKAPEAWQRFVPRP
ncbi:hypothetical protein [Desulfosoma caldarium]|uniref:TonB C-terminal domain-containing protein n=1 Tax=Desulfosoma caldarium TaxID=610254 RepID=A0A3N1VI07_9BACT|nr:hypothetical protein [Desulfosoma caldarium]ROR01669.1 hypothetical protein EDC27_0849 [Desulfosoma caldarium]